MIFSLFSFLSKLGAASLAEEVAEKMRASQNVRSVTVKDATSLSGVYADGSKFEFLLDNLKKEIAASPDQKEALIEKYVLSDLKMKEHPVGKDAPVEAKNILPIIRNISVANELESRGIDLHIFPGGQIAKDLILLYVDDAAETMTYLTLARMETAGVTKEEILDVAMENLRAQFEKIATARSGEFSQVLGDSDYVSSLLLADSLWDQIAQGDQGEVVVGIPARDVIYFSTTADAKGIEALRKKTEEVFDGIDHPISKNLYRWHEGKWVIYPGEK